MRRRSRPPRRSGRRAASGRGWRRCSSCSRPRRSSRAGCRPPATASTPAPVSSAAWVLLYAPVAALRPISRTTTSRTALRRSRADSTAEVYAAADRPTSRVIALNSRADGTSTSISPRLPPLGGSTRFQQKCYLCPRSNCYPCARSYRVRVTATNLSICFLELTSDSGH